MKRKVNEISSRMRCDIYWWTLIGGGFWSESLSVERRKIRYGFSYSLFLSQGTLQAQMNLIEN